jgi:hypothetical protein
VGNVSTDWAWQRMEISFGIPEGLLPPVGDHSRRLSWVPNAPPLEGLVGLIHGDIGPAGIDLKSLVSWEEDVLSGATACQSEPKAPSALDYLTANL